MWISLLHRIRRLTCRNRLEYGERRQKAKVDFDFRDAYRFVLAENCSVQGINKKIKLK